MTRQIEHTLWFLWTEDGPVQSFDFAPSSSEIRHWALDNDVLPQDVHVHVEVVTVVLANEEEL